MRERSRVRFSSGCSQSGGGSHVAGSQSLGRQEWKRTQTGVSAKEFAEETGLLTGAVTRQENSRAFPGPHALLLPLLPVCLPVSSGLSSRPRVPLPIHSLTWQPPWCSQPLSISRQFQGPADTNTHLCAPGSGAEDLTGQAVVRSTPDPINWGTGEDRIYSPSPCASRCRQPGFPPNLCLASLFSQCCGFVTVKSENGKPGSSPFVLAVCLCFGFASCHRCPEVLSLRKEVLKREAAQVEVLEGTATEKKHTGQSFKIFMNGTGIAIGCEVICSGVFTHRGRLLSCW